DVLLRVRNARKVYGDPPRLVRDVRRLDRWKAIALRGGLSSTDVRSPAAARRALLWQAGALGLLGYLHVLAQSAWGLFLLTLPTIAVLSGVAGSLAALMR